MEFAAGALWLAGAANAVTPPSDAGERADCVSCHRKQAISQPATLMARTLSLSGANPILQAHPRLTFSRGGFTYTVTTRDGKSTYSVTDGSKTLSLPIEWGMGAGVQTWLLTLDGRFYESLVSYYPSIDGLDLTLGDETSQPLTLVEAMGRKLADQDVKSCFGCHATGALKDDKLSLANFKPGVACEHCHLDAIAHSGDPLRRVLSSAGKSLGDLSSEDFSSFCGECHRTWSTVVLHRWFGELNVRFAPYRLALSKCYDGTDPRISCVACHDPHLNLDTGVADYDSKCLACHTPSKQTVSGTSGPEAKLCPVAKSNCATCHMPKVTQASGHAVFTDHFIRIVKAGEPYPY